MKIPRGPFSSGQIFWAVLILAAGLRVGLSLATHLIATDGEFFLWMAEDWRAGKFRDVVDNQTGYHPLYPILIAYGSYFNGGLVPTAFAVSVLFSTLVIFPLYYLARDIWDERIAQLTIFLYAVHPQSLDVGSDTMTEGTFLFFFFSAAALLWYAHRQGRPLLAVAAGVSAALAYLTRVEGIYLLVYCTSFGLFLAILYSFTKKPRRALNLLLVLLLFASVMLVVSSPYLMHIRDRTGQWHFTMKGSVPGASVTQESPRPKIEIDTGAIDRQKKNNRYVRWKQRYGNLLGASVGFLLYLAKAGQYVHHALVVLGILVIFFCPRFRGDRTGQLYHLLWSGGILLPIYLSLVLGRNDSDARYFLGAWIFLFPWGAIALLWLHQIWGSLHAVPLNWRRVGTVCCLVALVSPCFLEIVKQRRYNQILMLRAAEHVRDAFPPGETPRALATRLKFVYYAGARAPAQLTLDYQYMLELARHWQAPYLMGFRKDFSRGDPQWYEKASPRDLEPIPIDNPDPETFDDVVLYRVKGIPLVPPKGP